VLKGKFVTLRKGRSVLGYLVPEASLVGFCVVFGTLKLLCSWEHLVWEYYEKGLSMMERLSFRIQPNICLIINSTQNNICKVLYFYVKRSK
jgi:hypothetical protein